MVYPRSVAMIVLVGACTTPQSGRGDPRNDAPHERWSAGGQLGPPPGASPTRHDVTHERGSPSGAAGHVGPPPGASRSDAGVGAGYGAEPHDEEPHHDEDPIYPWG